MNTITLDNILQGYDSFLNTSELGVMKADILSVSKV